MSRSGEEKEKQDQCSLLVNCGHRGKTCPIYHEFLADRRWWSFTLHNGVHLKLPPSVLPELVAVFRFEAGGCRTDGKGKGSTVLQATASVSRNAVTFDMSSKFGTVGYGTAEKKPHRLCVFRKGQADKPQFVSCPIVSVN